MLDKRASRRARAMRWPSRAWLWIAMLTLVAGGLGTCVYVFHSRGVAEGRYRRYQLLEIEKLLKDVERRKLGREAVPLVPCAYCRSTGLAEHLGEIQICPLCKGAKRY